MSEGFEPWKAEKPKVLKFKRVQAIKLICFPIIGFFTVLKICFNFESVSVSLREICLVKIPELWYFCSNQWFLFLLTNVLVITLTYLSGSLAPSNGSEAIYEEYVRRSEAARKYNTLRPVSEKKKTISSQPPSFRQKNSGELRKRRSSECPETQKQIQSPEAKSLIVMDVLPSAESATVSTDELRRRSEAEVLFVPEVPSTQFARVSAEESQNKSEAESLILIEVPSEKPVKVSAEVSRSKANSLILMEASCSELANSSDEEFNRKMDEFIANFKGRLGKEESVVSYQEMKRRIVK